MKKFIIFIVIVALAIAAQVYFNKNDAELTGTPLPSGLERFESDDLGIEFLHDSTVDVEEEGDRVYVFTEGRDYKTGQFIEVFEKDEDESFPDAIRREFLKDYNSPLCSIEVSTSSQIYPNYQVAQIAYPQPTNPTEPPTANAKLCNEEYAMTNGIRYFLHDPNFPERYAFVSIGQYLLTAGDRPWQDTIKFTDD